MKWLVLVALTVAAVNADPAMNWYEVQPAEDAKDARLSETNVRKHWQAFKQKHSKKYASDEEEQSRFMKFSENFVAILEHNSEQVEGLHSFTLGLNEYSDLDIFEVRTWMNGFKPPSNYTKTGSTYIPPQTSFDLPTTVDWRSKGYVTPVKNQGHCGSCWAFSTTGSLEGQSFAKTGRLPSLSEQNLVDCSQAYGNHACNGGMMDNAFKYIRDNKGIDTENSYPYTAEEGTCHFKKAYVGGEDTGFVDISRGSEKQLMEAVANVGPVSVGIDASHKSFQHYDGGVYYEPACSSQKVDHAVLVVGYGTEKGQDYWLVKNSWGESWGEDGYIKMSRNKGDHCAIATHASYPLV